MLGLCYCHALLSSWSYKNYFEYYQRFRIRYNVLAQGPISNLWTLAHTQVHANGDRSGDQWPEKTSKLPCFDTSAYLASHCINVGTTVRLSLMQRHKSYWTWLCIWYCRTYYSGGSWHKPQNSHAALLDKYWTRLQIGNMTREELKKVSAPPYLQSSHTGVITDGV